jgi:hypothetical protein
MGLPPVGTVGFSGMSTLSRHKWLVLSLATTLAHALGVSAIGLYAERNRLDVPPHASALFNCHLAVAAIAIVLGVVAIAAERPRPLGILGVLLGLLSFAFWVG